MASVDSVAEHLEATCNGWRTFRVRPIGGLLLALRHGSGCEFFDLGSGQITFGQDAPSKLLLPQRKCGSPLKNVPIDVACTRCRYPYTYQVELRHKPP